MDDEDRCPGTSEDTSLQPGDSSLQSVRQIQKAISRVLFREDRAGSVDHDQRLVEHRDLSGLVSAPVETHGARAAQLSAERRIAVMPGAIARAYLAA